ncbi:MAG TPA: hypothetical protein VHW01_29200 [Polyangiaceae bacterium]|nr:hypothetical protein [Polyangiaceae bacterium]
MVLAPVSEYVHPTNTRSRVGVGAIDIGAYELGTGNDTAAAGASGAPGASGTTAQGGSSDAADAADAAGGSSDTGGLAGTVPSNAAPGAKPSSGCACRSAPGKRSGVLGVWLLPAAVLFVAESVDVAERIDLFLPRATLAVPQLREEQTKHV